MRLGAARQSAIAHVIWNWSSATVCFDWGVPDTVRNQRVLRGCILVWEKLSIDVGFISMLSEIVVVLRRTEL